MDARMKTVWRRGRLVWEVPMTENAVALGGNSRCGRILWQWCVRASSPAGPWRLLAPFSAHPDLVCPQEFETIDQARAYFRVACASAGGIECVEREE